MRITAVLLAAFVVLGATAASSSAKTRPDRAVASQASALLRQQTMAPSVTSAAPVVNQAGCEANVLPANDDGSTGEVELPFELNFFGSQYSSLWVNNNGNVTFGGPLGIYTPFNIEATTPPMIAPFFADVDTRGAGSGLVTYGTTTFEGHAAFCVDWLNVGYYSERTDKLNDFQLLLVNRSDAAPGDFDIVFNYGKIEWETGEASEGVDGLGGISAGAGYSNGDGEPGDFYQLPGSLENGAFLDSNAETGLVNKDYGTSVRGRYVFHVTGAPNGSGGSSDLSRSWPGSGFGYSFANAGMPTYLKASSLALGDVISPQGLTGVFSDWARNAAASGGPTQSIARLGPFMANGLCFGLALSGGRFDAGLDALSDPAAGRTDAHWASAGTGPSATMNLPAPGGAGSSTAYDKQFLGLVGDDFLSQYSTQVNESWQRQHYAFADPTSGAARLRSQLESAMGEGRNLYDYSGRLSSPSGTGFAGITIQLPALGGHAYFGHEVLAYSLESRSGNAFQIDVWDNNFPGQHYAIVVEPDGTWTYNAPYPGGTFSGDLSLSGAPGKQLGLLAVLPPFNPTNLNFFPQATGGLGTGSLVDIGPEEAVASASDSGGEPVDIEPITADEGGNNGAVVDLPSDAGEITLEGEGPSLDVRGEDSFMTAASDTSDSPVTFSEDEQEGSIKGDESDLELSVARGQRVVKTEGAGGLAFTGEGTVTASNTSGHLTVQLEFLNDGSVTSTTLFDGATDPGSDTEFSGVQLTAAEAAASAHSNPSGPTSSGEGTGSSSPGPSGATTTNPSGKKKPLICRKGRKKRKVHGKARCVRVKSGGGKRQKHRTKG